VLKPVYEVPWYRLLCFYRREINLSFMRQTFSTMDCNRLLSHSINLIHVILTLSLPNTQGDFRGNCQEMSRWMKVFFMRQSRRVQRHLQQILYFARHTVAHNHNDTQSF
jgi:hypothetical protein